MQIDNKTMMVAFALGIIVPFLLMFFVFSAVAYTWIGVLLIVMIELGIFMSVTFVGSYLAYGGFPIEVTIFEKRASSIYISRDRAKRIAGAESGKFAYFLKTKKIKTKPIDISFLYTGTRGQSYLLLFMPQINEFHPLTIEDAGDLKITPENARYWYSEQLRRNAERWNKKFGFEKYAGMIQLGMTGLIIVLLLYVFLGQMQGVVAQINGITAAQTELTKEITKLLEIMWPSLSGGNGSLPFLPT